MEIVMMPDSPLAAFDSSTLFAVGVLMIAIVLVRYVLKPKRGGVRYESPLDKDRATAGHMLDAPPGVGRWEVQMHDTARDLMGELNSKISIVQQLIIDANAAAERLENAIERADKHV